MGAKPFLSPDPIGPLNGGSTSGNRYSYAGYDPINFVDPTGFQQEPMAECSQVAPDPDGTPNIECWRIGPEPGYPDPNTPPDDPNLPKPGGEIDCDFGDCVSDDEVVDLTAGNSGSTSQGTPRIFNTADGPLFGVAGTTYLPSPSELLEDYYTPEGTMVTCSVAGPGCSDGSGYVLGWPGNPYTLRGRELDGAAGAFAGELSLIPQTRMVFNSEASVGDRLWAGGEIGVTLFGGAILRGGGRLIGAAARFGEGGGAILYHGTDLASAARMAESGLDRAAARALGGGDVFWTTSDLGTARWFAQANPAMSETVGVVGMRLPTTLAEAQNAGLIALDKTGAWVVQDWRAFNETVIFFLVP